MIVNFTTVFGSQLTKVFQIDSDGLQVLGLLPFWHPLNRNFTWVLLMRSFKSEQRSILRTCKRKTEFWDVQNKKWLSSMKMILEPWGLVLSWNDHPVLLLECYKLRQEIILSGWWDGLMNFFVFLFLVMSSCPFLAAPPTVASNWNIVALRDISWDMASPLLNECNITLRWVCIRNARLCRFLWRHNSWRVVKTFSMCLYGDLHLFIANLVVSSISRRRHKFESLESLISIDTVTSSNTWKWKMFIFKHTGVLHNILVTWFE